MTRHIFMQELRELNQHVIRMGSLLEQSMNDVIVALERLDADLANQIIKRDDAIDELEHQIEKECIAIIAKQQPLASDLRKVTSIMKIVTDIERIADHCADISEYIILLSQQSDGVAPKNLKEMVNTMKGMVIETIDSFVEVDLEKANQVIAKDDIVDNYFASISDELTQIMLEKKEAIPASVSYLMIIKYLERMADHATNIAEWIEYIITGKMIE
ncbi:phosphate signaling complex protein PhoU [Anaerosporobacter faecicola]|uniref:phosphate signaling complex protein PhoU n=1 Tax=Anaerosporobacter faecicola TaxID=2718714 RepID=UPI0014386FBA|nr:phosphate signaling complex protein PhoU [Anaerosporobacter faecicola]